MQIMCLIDNVRNAFTTLVREITCVCDNFYLDVYSVFHIFCSGFILHFPFLSNSDELWIYLVCKKLINFPQYTNVCRYGLFMKHFMYSFICHARWKIFQMVKSDVLLCKRCIQLLLNLSYASTNLMYKIQ